MFNVILVNSAFVEIAFNFINNALMTLKKKKIFKNTISILHTFQWNIIVTKARGYQTYNFINRTRFLFQTPMTNEIRNVWPNI